MKLLHKTLLFTLLFGLFISCKKNTPEPEPQLPPITQEGLNTFGCLINGEVFLPGRGMSIITSLDCFFEALSIGAGDDLNRSAGFDLFDIVDCNSQFPQNYIVDDNLLAGYTTGYSGGAYSTDSLRTGVVTINYLNLSARIVAGTFYFDAFNKNDSSIVSITDGRFDINY